MIITLLLFGVVVGLLFGIGEGITWRMRIKANDRRTLPHAWLLTARLTISFLLGMFFVPFQEVLLLEAGQPDMGWWHIVLRCGGILFIFLTMAHRVTFNLWTGRPFWYMGDHQHKPGDSIYDTLMWTVAALLFLWTRRWHDSLVWVTAMAFEGGALYLLWRW